MVGSRGSEGYAFGAGQEGCWQEQLLFLVMTAMTSSSHHDQCRILLIHEVGSISPDNVEETLIKNAILKKIEDAHAVSEARRPRLHAF